MRLIHISDLHIGKKVNRMSMLDEQRHILSLILDRAAQEDIDAVMIAGDVYDTSMPSSEAVVLFDDFLTGLASTGKPVMLISGNHDSAERIAFGSRIMTRSGIHLSPVYSGDVEPLVLMDEYGELAVYMLPFVKPATVRYHFPEEEAGTYDDAVKAAVSHMDIDTSRRNVLIAHQFVTDSVRCDSEEASVGGLDNVDSSAFDAFDYVALGHLHRPQSCSRETVRYCGSPLKYSFSEVDDRKSITIVELRGKGDTVITTEALVPMHDWYDLKGSYAELTAKSYYEDTPWQEGFTRITLTDENDIPDAVGKLRTIYHNLMELRYDNSRTRAGLTEVGTAQDVEEKSPLELFSELYVKQNGGAMSEQQLTYMKTMIDSIWDN